MDKENKKIVGQKEQEQNSEINIKDGLVLRFKNGEIVIIDKQLISSKKTKRIAYYESGFRKVDNFDKWQRKVIGAEILADNYKDKIIEDVKKVKAIDGETVEIIESVKNKKNQEKYNKQRRLIIEEKLGEAIDADNEKISTAQNLTQEDFFDIQESLLAIKKLKKEIQEKINKQKKVGEKFIEMYPKDSDYALGMKNENGHEFSQDSFTLMEHIGKNKMKIKWHNTSEEEEITRSKFRKLLKKGFLIEEEHLTRVGDSNSKNNAEESGVKNIPEVDYRETGKEGNKKEENLETVKQQKKNKEHIDNYGSEVTAIINKKRKEKELEKELNNLLTENPGIEKNSLRARIQEGKRENIDFYDKLSAKDKILMLEGRKVELARSEYAKKEYELNSKWMGLKKVFDKKIDLGNTESEIRQYRETYKQALTAYTEAIIQIEGVEDKEEREIMLRYVGINDALSMEDEKLKLKMEDSSFRARLGRIGVGLGKTYNTVFDKLRGGGEKISELVVGKEGKMAKIAKFSGRLAGPMAFSWGLMSQIGINSVFGVREVMIAGSIAGETLKRQKKEEQKAQKDKKLRESKLLEKFDLIGGKLEKTDNRYAEKLQAVLKKETDEAIDRGEQDDFDKIVRSWVAFRGALINRAVWFGIGMEAGDLMHGSSGANSSTIEGVEADSVKNSVEQGQGESAVAEKTQSVKIDDSNLSKDSNNLNEAVLKTSKTAIDVETNEADVVANKDNIKTLGGDEKTKGALNSQSTPDKEVDEVKKAPAKNSFADDELAQSKEPQAMADVKTKEVEIPNAEKGNIYEVQLGDNTWNILKNNLPWDKLEQAGLDIDNKEGVILKAVKIIEENPSEYGVKSTEHISPGDNIEIKKVIDKLVEGRAVEPIVEPAVEPAEEDKAVLDDITHKDMTDIEGNQAVEHSPDEQTSQLFGVARNIGLEPAELATIKDVSVEKLLSEIPSENEAWSIWRGDASSDSLPIGENNTQIDKFNKFDLPHSGIYDVSEFGKQVDLATFIRENGGENVAGGTTVEEFLKNIKTDSLPENLIEEITAEEYADYMGGMIKGELVEMINSETGAGRLLRKITKADALFGGGSLKNQLANESLSDPLMIVFKKAIEGNIGDVPIKEGETVGKYIVRSLQGIYENGKMDSFKYTLRNVHLQ